MTYLLDTSVVSELRRRQPDPRVLAWYAGIASADLFISVLTVGEIRLGIERLRRKDAAQADLLEHWLQGLQVTYADHIVDDDTGIAEQWGRATRTTCP
jgi:predicted nucleic acid-binding protein